MSDDRDREDLMFYWTGELDEERRRGLDERMARDLEFKALADNTFAALGMIFGEPSALRSPKARLGEPELAIPGFEPAAFFDEELAPGLPRRSRPWATAAAAVIALLAAFVLGAQLGAPSATPARAPEAARLQAAYASSVQGEDGLARGLLALSALSRRR